MRHRSVRRHGVVERDRRRVPTGELTKRSACREYDLHWETLEKILTHVDPPGYRRKAPRRKPKIEPFLRIIQEIFESDRTAPKKQRHTAKRIWERLRTNQQQVRLRRQRGLDALLRRHRINHRRGDSFRSHLRRILARAVNLAPLRPDRNA